MVACSLEKLSRFDLLSTLEKTTIPQIWLVADNPSITVQISWVHVIEDIKILVSLWDELIYKTTYILDKVTDSDIWWSVLWVHAINQHFSRVERVVHYHHILAKDELQTDRWLNQQKESYYDQMH